MPTGGWEVFSTRARARAAVIAPWCPFILTPLLRGWALPIRVNPKTVFRGGVGVSYGQVSPFNYIGGGNSQGMGFNTLTFPASETA